ncbi:MAG: hypothetical protein Q7K65_05705 [Candidatus Buchananbacteria bacterium]|nr:hypothetical protein [Candidatus Buchananbacteria bacterium]
MIVPKQEIKYQDGNKLLFIRIYEFDQLVAKQIKAIVNFFQRSISGLDIDYLHMFINVAPLDERFHSYIFFVKLSDHSFICASAIGMGGDIVVNFSQVFGEFAQNFDENIANIGTINQNNDETAETLIDPLGLAFKPVDIDAILKDFKDEQKRKENKE